MSSIAFDTVKAVKHAQDQSAVQAALRSPPSFSRGAVARTILLPGRVNVALFRAAAVWLVADMEALRSVAAAGSCVSSAYGPGIALLDFSDRPNPQEDAASWLRAAGRVLLHPDADRAFAWALARMASDHTLWLQAYHWAVLDPAAQDLVAARIIGAYAALVEGRPLPPSQVGLSHATQQGKHASVDRAWYEAQLRDPPSLLSAALPRRSSAVGPASDDRAGETVRHSIDAQAGGLLSNIARALGATRPQLLCAAWTALLHRLAYQDDLLLGLAVSGRGRATRQRLDWFAGVVPLRLRVAEDERFGDWARRVARQMRAALRHQRNPVSQGQEIAKLEAPGLQPLAVVFNHLPRRPAMTLDGSAVVTCTLDLGLGSSHDLVLSVEDGSDGGLVLLLDANHADYRPDEAVRLMRRLALLLDSLTTAGTAAGALRIADLAIMDADERQLVTGRFAHGPPAPPRRTLIELLAGRVPQDPKAPALVVVSSEGTTRLSWGELDARSNRLARQLLAGGLSPGDTAAVLLPRNETLIVAVLACARAGIAYCPLDLAQPPARLEYMMRACKARRLLTDMEGASRLQTEVEALLVDDPAMRASIEAQLGAALSDADRGAPVGPDTIAYVIFTSGSTGLPKGVAVAHAAIGQSAQAFASEMEMRSGQAIIMVVSIAFDPATIEIFSGLSSGALLVLLDDVMRRDPGHIVAAVERFQPAILEASPSVWRSLPIEAFPKTLAAVVGGEGFPAELVSRMRNLGSVTNAYGPTETAVVCAMHKLGLQDEWARPVRIGRPIAGNQIWIVDRGRRPVPVGALGELCVGGPTLAACYVGQPAQTEAAFLPSPFGPGRIYLTGDLARWRADGCIEVVGRIDQQVKLRGYRIELGEIEHVLRSVSGLSDAAVVVRGEGPDARLVAYLACDADAVVPVPVPVPVELEAALAERLPSWMVPNTFIRLPMLPRTVNGKLDRAALQEAPSTDRAVVTATSASAPRTPDEALLCLLFTRLTGYAEVAGDSDFFQIGGNSLRAMILVTELRQHGRSLPLASLYSERTPAAIAAIWSRGARHNVVVSRPTLFVIPGCGGDNPGLASFRVRCSDTVDCVLLEYPDWLDFAADEFDFSRVVVSMADHIRARLPPGPLLLAGYSMGGLVAWAVGRRLEEQGSPPDLLCLIDPVLTESNKVSSRHTYLGSVALRLSKIPKALRVKGVSVFLGDVRDTLLWAATSRLLKRRKLLRCVARLRILRLPAKIRYDLHYSIAFELQRQAVDHWRRITFSAKATGYSGKATLFRASERVSGAIDFAWMEHCENFTSETVEGNHRTILQARGAHSLSAKLRQALTSISAGGSFDGG